MYVDQPWGYVLDEEEDEDFFMSGGTRAGRAGYRAGLLGKQAQINRMAATS